MTELQNVLETCYNYLDGAANHVLETFSKISYYYTLT